MLVFYADKVVLQVVRKTFQQLLKSGDDKYCKVLSVALNSFLKRYRFWPHASSYNAGSSSESDSESPAVKRSRHSGSSAAAAGGSVGGATLSFTIPDDDEVAMSEDL